MNQSVTFSVVCGLVGKMHQCLWNIISTNAVLNCSSKPMTNGVFWLYIFLCLCLLAPFFLCVLHGSISKGELEASSSFISIIASGQRSVQFRMFASAVCRPPLTSFCKRPALDSLCIDRESERERHRVEEREERWKRDRMTARESGRERGKQREREKRDGEQRSACTSRPSLFGLSEQMTVNFLRAEYQHHLAGLEMQKRGPSRISLHSSLWDTPLPVNKKRGWGGSLHPFCVFQTTHKKSREITNMTFDARCG